MFVHMKLWRWRPRHRCTLTRQGRIRNVLVRWSIRPDWRFGQFRSEASFIGTGIVYFWVRHLVMSALAWSRLTVVIGQFILASWFWVYLILIVI